MQLRVQVAARYQADLGLLVKHTAEVVDRELVFVKADGCPHGLFYLHDFFLLLDVAIVRKLLDRFYLSCKLFHRGKEGAFLRFLCLGEFPDTTRVQLLELEEDLLVRDLL